MTLIHLIGIPITNLSVNPARSTGPALVVGGWALAQLWMFWVAPIAGAVLGAAIYGAVAHVRPAERVGAGAAAGTGGTGREGLSAEEAEIAGTV